MTEDLLELALDRPRPRRGGRASGNCSTHGVRASCRSPTRRSASSCASRARQTRRSLSCAPRCATHGRSSRTRLADVRATYGYTLVLRRAHARACASSIGQSTRQVRRLLAKVLMRRACALTMLGRQESALADMAAGPRRHSTIGGSRRGRRAPHHPRLHPAGPWACLHDAESAFDEALQTLRADGDDVEALDAVHNLGEVAFRRGDIPALLTIYRRTSPEPRPSVASSGVGNVPARADAYLAAGLTTEAVDVVETFMQTSHSRPAERARLAVGAGAAPVWLRRDPTAAIAVATQAREALPPPRARLVRAAGTASCRSARETSARRHAAGSRRQPGTLLTDLTSERADEAPDGLILAGRLATGPERIALLSAGRGLPGPAERAGPGQCLAGRRARAGGRRRPRRRAARLRPRPRCARRAPADPGQLGAAGAGHHARPRARRRSRLRHAATSDARTLLRWSERWRATALAQPPVTPDGDVSPELAALRDNGRRLAEARAEGEADRAARGGARRLERAVRAEHHRLAGQADRADPRLDVERLVAEVGDAALVELVDVDGVLHVLVVERREGAPSDRRARRRRRWSWATSRSSRCAEPPVVGRMTRATWAAACSRRCSVTRSGCCRTVRSWWRRPARLHGIPWALLPTLAERSFSSVPSAAQWLRASAATTTDERLRAPGRPRPRHRRGGGAGAREAASRTPCSSTESRATVEAAMAALDGAGLAHVAAHGHFRADSPLFSSLELADGPLTVHDLERLQRGAVPAGAVGVRVRRTRSGRCRRAAGPGVGAVLDRHRRPGVQRRRGQRRGDGGADGRPARPAGAQGGGLADALLAARVGSLRRPHARGDRCGVPGARGVS